MLPLRIALSLSLALALSATSAAQIYIRPPPILPPGDTQTGDSSAGPSNLVGTDGPDRFEDEYWTRGDTDTQHDSPGGPDGQPDRLDTIDGDGLDSMFGGPEDSFEGDPNDRIFILRPRNQRGSPVLWHGTVTEYRRMQALLRYLQDNSYLMLVAQGGDLGDPCGFWRVAYEDGVAALSIVPEGTELVIFSDWFALGPYAHGEVPPSPGDFFAWSPFPEGDPCAETAELTMTSDEYQLAAVGALDLLAAVRDAACEVPTEDVPVGD
ncbi:MAG: hypothetical protein IPJ77_11970 [Planctomycetes bacterium]|nr:hypothetical protein [Planctomycetota bacterium]